MRCRRIEDGELVFFGSKGKKEDETVNPAQGAITNSEGHYIDGSYVGNIEGVQQSLAQRLLLLQRELPHFMSSGFPLASHPTKPMLDAYLINVISQHPDVIAILNVDSIVTDYQYQCSVKIQTSYGITTFSQSNLI